MLDFTLALYNGRFGENVNFFTISVILILLDFNKCTPLESYHQFSNSVRFSIFYEDIYVQSMVKPDHLLPRSEASILETQYR